MKRFLFLVVLAAAGVAFHQKRNPDAYKGLEASARERAEELKSFSGLVGETVGSRREENLEAVTVFKDPGIAYKMAAEIARAEGNGEAELERLEAILSNSRDKRLRAEAAERIAEIRGTSS